MNRNKQISKSNYESFFIDCLEGLLDKSGEEELFLFLQNNPHLKEEFNLIQQLKLQANDSQKLDEKDSLKVKDVITVGAIHEKNYENYFIADVENELNNDEKKNLIAFLTHNIFLQKEYQLFQKTIIGSPVISYQNKNELKKPLVVALPVFRMAVAAAVLLMFGLFFKGFFTKNQQDYISPMSSLKYERKMPVKINLRANRNHTVMTEEKRDIREKRSNYRNHKIETKNIATNTDDIQENIRQEESMVAVLTSRSSKANLSLSDNRLQIEPRNSYAETFLDLRLAEMIDFARENPEILNRINKGKSPSRRFDAWDIANIGLSSFNLLTNSDFKINREKDENDKTKLFAISGGHLSE